MSPAVWREHGDPRRYSQGCRCDRCRAANSERERLRRRHLAAHNVNGVAEGIKHGRWGYTNSHCRCAVCVAGHRAGVAADRARRVAGRRLVDGRLVAVDAPQHGKSSTYINYGCRCVDCTDAHRRDRTPTRRSA